MKVLHVVASPRSDRSNTLRVTESFFDAVKAHPKELEVETVDLYNYDLPGVAGENIDNKYLVMGGASLNAVQAAAWKDIEELIANFLGADLYVISSPMWNFSVPYALKYYIDAVVQPGYTFRYDEQGRAVGTVEGKKMLCITSRGGDYSPGTPFHSYDFQEPYLRAIFGFIGVTDVEFVNAQPMDITPELREQAISAATERARELVPWALSSVVGDTPVTPSPPELKPEPLDPLGH